MTPDLRLNWAQWLETFRWDYFLTVTLRDPLPAYRGESTLNSIGRQLCKRHKPELLFVGAERHLSLNMHFHGLYLSTYAGHERDAEWQREMYLKIESTEIWQTLFNTYGRSRVDVVRSAKDVSKYVSKYCVKELDCYAMFGRREWEVVDPDPRAVSCGSAPKSVNAECDRKPPAIGWP